MNFLFDVNVLLALGYETTDGHLVALAATLGRRLATLDRQIPGAEIISEPPERWMVREAPAEYRKAA